MSRHKLKRPPPEIGLFMECEDEELNPAQKEHYGKIKKDYTDFEKKLSDYIKKTDGKVVIEEGDCFLFQIKHGFSKTLSKNSGSLVAIENKTSQPIKQTPIPSNLNTPIKSGHRNRRSVRVPTPSSAPIPTPSVEHRGTRSSRAAATLTASSSAPSSSTRKAAKVTPVVEDTRCEATAIGGLCIGKKISPKGTFHFGGDSLESVVNKGSVKTYASFSIFAKPSLQLKPSLISQSNTERANLDLKVKGVLMLTPAKFTEWLIQQGLIRSEQHVDYQGNRPVLLKLGMYSDVSKFPYSGGYVWISDSPPPTLVSVYNNSIFEGSPHVPNVILKLMYHWCCQTNVANVLQWVNVEPLFLKNVYTLLRSVCVISVHQKYGWIGGPLKKVQIGIFSLDPVHSNDADRASKQDILCIFDSKKKLLRFHAIDMEHYGKKRSPKNFLACLSSLVHKDSIICCDNLIKNDCLQFLGFKHFDNTPNCNKDIMEYSRKVLPKLFHNTLQHLSRPLVQQFLDELVWRERWGPIAAYAFNNLIINLAEITREEPNDNLIKRLKFAALNPFSLPPIVYPYLDDQIPVETPKRGQKRAAEQMASYSKKPPPAKKSNIPKQEVENKSNWKVSPLDNISPEITAFLSEPGKVSVEYYYYGIINGDESKIVDRKPAEVTSTKCCICLKPFSDNLALMKHLLLHCQVKPQIVGPLRNVHQCTKCFLGLPTATALKNHNNSTHSAPENLKNFVCQICRKMFADNVQFLYHMHRTHVANELPYFCEVCSYRCSSYEQIIEHITHSHRSGQHIFCPCCLKAVGLFQNNLPLPGNVLFYINHVQRHKLSEETRCHRCTLSFVSLPLLQRHLERDHTSFSSNPDLRHLSSVGGIMMPEPSNLIKPALIPRIKKPVLKPGVLRVKPFSSPIKYNLEPGLVCAECEGFLDNPDHFQGEAKCCRCKYMSYCEYAVHEHFALYHGGTEPLTTCPGKPFMLQSNMHCSCGFSSSSPNTLAKHLVVCGKITAYPNEAAAKIALQSENKKSTFEDEPNVLNMLGLIRKSPEPTTEAEPEPGESCQSNFKILLKNCDDTQGTQPTKSVPSTEAVDAHSNINQAVQSIVHLEENHVSNKSVEMASTDFENSDDVMDTQSVRLIKKEN